MKIISIFAAYLYAFEPEDGINEYDRCMEIWTDTEYLRDYAKRNHILHPSKFALEVLEDIEEIQDILKRESDAESLFRPLYDNEYPPIVLSLQKGKLRNSYLRLYAIRVDEGIFVITGGAIKITRTMQEHPDTVRELEKIKNAQRYLNAQGVGDADSFYEFLIDTSHD